MTGENAYVTPEDAARYAEESPQIEVTPEALAYARRVIADAETRGDITFSTGHPMTDRIEPALTAEEWERARSGCDDIGHHYYTGDKGAVIAIANDELPDSDKRKITRDWVTAIRDAIECIDGDWGHGPAATGEDARSVALGKIAAALDSYLPPE